MGYTTHTWLPHQIHPTIPTNHVRIQAAPDREHGCHDSFTSLQRCTTLPTGYSTCKDKGYFTPTKLQRCTTLPTGD
ncbi:hypothetical protein EJB05_50487 [Eragrostis curvula]|uniref:Uncharacterized protein n=1 Tax=Eragrostis curvula TaxID=38414 RepID=A0A5J9SY90_9POAL|nr:hypothetical protein EJB05_50487 [Eragrostis curvula]